MDEVDGTVNGIADEGRVITDLAAWNIRFFTKEIVVWILVLQVGENHFFNRFVGVGDQIDSCISIEMY